MKRIFSFALAAMMTITMGILPAFAEPHGSHFIKFTGDSGAGIVLPEATEGEAYSYALPIETCSELSGFSVTLASGNLPEGLNLTPAGGISGIPAAGTASTYEFQVEARGTCPEQSDTPLVTTVECTITVAHGHVMSFDKDLMIEHAGGGFDLPPATEGESYSYQLQYKKCDHMSNIQFSANVSMDPAKCLPGGLSLDVSTGIISGIPAEGTAGDYEVELQVQGDCTGTPPQVANSNTFYLTVQPEQRVVTWRIPYTKRVVRGGSRNPGSQTFELEIFDVGYELLEDQVTIFGNTGSIDTNGAGNYSDHVSVTAPEDALDEGFKVREKHGNAAHWTYSDAVYTIWPERGLDETTFKIYEGDYSGVDGEGTVCTTMTFTNTYTYSPSYDRDDDDDDDRDRPDPKPEKVQPEKDEEQSNPVTGR